MDATALSNLGGMGLCSLSLQFVMESLATVFLQVCGLGHFYHRFLVARLFRFGQESLWPCCLE